LTDALVGSRGVDDPPRGTDEETHPVGFMRGEMLLLSKRRAVPKSHAAERVGRDDGVVAKSGSVRRTRIGV
jgi:hypothetical protein